MGEEKVKPEFTPQSNGRASIEILSTQRSLRQSYQITININLRFFVLNWFQLATMHRILTWSDWSPINQSGDGISFVTKDAYEKLLLRKMRDSTLSSGFSSFGIENSSNTWSLSSFSKLFESPVVQKSFKPVFASSPISYNLKFPSCDTPKDFEKWAWGRNFGKCLGKLSSLQWPWSSTLYTAKESKSNFN